MNATIGKAFRLIALTAVLYPAFAGAAIVSPPVADIALKPGGFYTGDFNVFFTREDPELLYLSVQKVDYTDLTNEPNASVPTTGENTLANWLKLDTYQIAKLANIQYLNGDNAVKVNYSMTIPADAPPGGHYAAVIVSERPFDGGSANGAQVSIGADVAIQILINVDGEQKYSTDLVSFQLKGGQKFLSSLPVEFETTFKNNGNVHVIPRGNIELFQGGNKVGITSLNSSQLRVIPSKSRLYESIWSEEGIENITETVKINEAKATLPDSFWEHVIYQLNHFRIGQFTAKLQGFAGKQPSFEAEVTFLVIPWHLLLIVALILALIVSLVLASGSILRSKRR